MAKDRAPPPRMARRDLGVLAMVALLPLLLGSLMLAPGRHTLLGLASTGMTMIAPAMVLAWPATRPALWPGGRMAALAAMIICFGVLLALVRAPYPALSLTTLGAWVAAMVAGRAVQLRMRLPGAFPRAMAIAILLAGPLYVPLLPLMDLLYGDTHAIDWSRDMPGFRHVRKMGHLLVASAAAGIGLVMLGPRGATRSQDAALTVLALIALALAIWTGARGAWLALIATILLTWATGHAAGHGVRTGRVLTVLAGAVALGLILPSPGPHLGILEEFSTSAARLEAGDLNHLTSNRLELWSRALEAATQAPLVGPGWGQFILIAPSTATLHAHSLPMELLYAFGLPMGLLAGGLLLTLWIEAHRRVLRAGADLMPALAILDAMTLYALVSGTYFYGVPVVLTGIAWGICLSPRPAPG